MPREGDGVLVWSRLARRSRDLAKAMHISIYHIGDKPPYLRAWRETGRLFKRLGSEACIILQLPPGPAVYRATRIRSRPKLLCDVHTGMFYYSSLKERFLNRPFLSFLKGCDYVLAHNPESEKLLLSKLGEDVSIYTIYDPLPQISETIEPSVKPDGDFIVLPIAWEADEDVVTAVKAFIRVANLHKNVYMVITGDYKRKRSLYKKVLSLLHKHRITEKVLLTGYIDYKKYLWYIKNSILVIALTNREYTVLSAMWEAALYNRPIAYPSTRTLTNLLGVIDSGLLRYTVGDEFSLARVIHIALTNRKKVARIGKLIGDHLRDLSNLGLKRLSSLCQ